MEKIDIYFYWVGGGKAPHNVAELNKKFKKLNFILGPSDDEHKFLMEKSPYYRKCFENKVYAHCSDVYQSLVLSRGDCYYFDIHTEVGTNVEEYLIKLAKTNKDIFWKGYQNNLGPAAVGSFSKDKKAFKKCMWYYKKWEADEFNLKFKIYPILPELFSNVVEDTYNTKIDGYVRQEYDEIILLTYPEIRNKKTIFNNGSGSWIKNGSNIAIKIREQLDLYWKRKKGPSTKRFNMTYQLDTISINRFRDCYDISESRKTIKKLNKIYRTQKKLGRINLTFSNRLIWSKLYRIATFKWIQYFKKEKND